MRKGNPKTGERRRKHQPFAIDRLPDAWRERIIALRAKFLTWEQIERESRTWEWAALDAKCLGGHFADHRIPATTLHRWYDVQVTQRLKEAAALRESSNSLAEMFSRSGQALDDSVKNSMADVIFSSLLEPGNKELYLKSLQNLAKILARSRELDVREQRGALAKVRTISLRKN